MAGSEGIPLILKLKITKSVNIISFLGSSSARALFPEPSIKTEDLVQVQLNTGLSNLGMKKLASTINRVSDTKIVETSFLAKFEAIGKQLSEFFTQTSIQVLSESNSTDFVVVHCKDLAELLNEVLLSRRVFQNHIVKLGIDGGGGFLKVSLGIMELDSHCDSRSPPRKKLLTQRTAKDSSVKRQMLVALSEGLPENFENVRQILSLIKLDKVNFGCLMRHETCQHPLWPSEPCKYSPLLLVQHRIKASFSIRIFEDTRLTCCLLSRVC